MTGLQGVSYVEALSNPNVRAVPPAKALFPMLAANVCVPTGRIVMAINVLRAEAPLNPNAQAALPAKEISRISAVRVIVLYGITAPATNALHVAG